MKTCRWHAAAAPPLQPWIGRSPMAVRKSTDLEPKGPPPCIVAIAFDLDLITCIFQTFNNWSRRLRTPAREEGARQLRRVTSTRKEAGKWSDSAEPRHGRRSPPPQTTNPTAPPEVSPPRFPHPPAAEAAGRGGETSEPPPAN
ncbi:hypothetical protein VPH35_125101 [Triticum aestivum]|uniref:Uncharacterized protein n=1 Tax=Triticum turgidum subsp. durum TaxID=4567 RepID=A0A9R0ZM57_TRITD|nr:unnamed protein product [Triticum turgidum subsp. durum]